MSTRHRRGSAERDGVVAEVLPKEMFGVRLDDGTTIRASLGSSARHSIVRLIVGDRVTVTLSTHDPTRGRITAKI